MKFESEIAFFRNQTGFKGKVEIVLANLGNTLGQTDGRKIWLSKFLPVNGVKNTLFHELWHCQQIASGKLNLLKSTFEGKPVKISDHREPYEIETRRMAEKLELEFNRAQVAKV